jgi:hypothetical protein
MITRRGLLAGILAAGAAPAIVRNPMRIWVPRPPDEAWGFRLLQIDPNMVDLQEALIRQVRAMADQMNLANNPPMIIGQIDRVTIYVSPNLPADPGRVVRHYGRVGPLRLR